MSDTLKQVIALASTLSYEENEALRSVLFSINYERKDKLERDIKALTNQA